MAVNKGEIGIYGVLRRDGGDNVLANTDQIKDKQLNKLQEELNRGSAEHITNTNNPHNVTKEQIGLSNVTNDAQVKRNEMGVANGVATLNANAKIPNNLLDSIIVKYNTTSELPTNGESNKIYIVNNLLYIWDGTKYEEVSKSLDIGTTKGTAYEGSKGKALENNKVDKVEGKSLVSNTDITKLSELPSNGDLNNKLNAKLDKSAIESTITADSNNPVSSAAINTYINNTVTTIKNKVTKGWWLPIKEGEGSKSVIEGMASSASGKASHAEGVSSQAIGDYSHAEQSGFAIGMGSHAEGASYANGDLSHVEGKSKASGRYSHAQGCNNYDDASFIDMVGVCPENFSDNTNASVIYVGRTSNGDINRKDPKNGYQYLINIGGYQGKTIKEGMKSVQEVIADLETNKVDKVEGKQLSTNDYTTAEKNKVAESINESTTNTLISTAINNLTKNSVGLGNVDNTADINKEVKTATQLKTTRNIWGKAFNGSVDIEGDMNEVTEIYLTDGTKYAEPCTEEEINALFV